MDFLLSLEELNTAVASALSDTNVKKLKEALLNVATLPK